MNTQAIIAMAKEAGARSEHWATKLFPAVQFLFTPDDLSRFAALVAAKEREECATLVQLGPPPVTGFGSRVEIGFGARTAYAAAIRARGQKEGA